jgi:hypothetical protein
MKHKWANEIKAWADGAEIEFLSENEWLYAGDPEWNEDSEYRIKPQPKEPRYLYAYKYANGDRVHLTAVEIVANKYALGKIKLEDEK